jgi:sugar phosphate isomerase/epimerase
MKVKWICPLWGMTGATLRDNLTMAKTAGFDGVEMGVPADSAQKKELASLLRELGLDLIHQQWTTGADAAAHAKSFEEQYRRGVELGPIMVNSHTGRDIFTLAENSVVFRAAESLEKSLRVPVAHELHRGRPTFSSTSTMELLDTFPNLRLTADFSHWCCVHETLLEDQPERVERAIAHTRHIHARVGHGEAPQVPDPRVEAWRPALEAHLAWWKAIAAARAAAGDAVLTVCPEFGPPPYLVTLPDTGKPIVDLWAVNRWMKDFLKDRLFS